MKACALNASRVALIHATPLAIAPVVGAFVRLWPQAKLMNLLDDCLSADLAETGSLDGALVERFIDLAQYAKRAGAQGILFTCSAFGPAIEAAAAVVGVPTYKPNEAMFCDALEKATPGRPLQVGLLSTFAPSVAQMAQELRDAAQKQNLQVDLQTCCVPDAMAALTAGKPELHDQLLAEHSSTLAACDVVMLGQFSMARAQSAVASRLKKLVLTSPDSAVGMLKRTLSGTSQPTL